MIAAFEPLARPLRVVLVEDNPGDVFFVRRGLARLKTSTQLTVFESGEDAAAYLGCMGLPGPDEPPDVILLDLNLPGMKGLELLECVRHSTRLRDTCVVILTSSSAEIDVERARALNADDYYLKPNTLPKLYRLLEELETRWLSKMPLPCNRGPSAEAWPHE